jgi:hypothetical protein
MGAWRVLANHSGDPSEGGVQHTGHLHVLGDLMVDGNVIGSGGLPWIRGTWFFVDPTSGDNNYDGKSPGTAFASFYYAEDACTDGAGDGICIISRGTTAAATTSYLTAALTFDKSGITVVGIAAPVSSFGRARISNATTSTGLAKILDITGANNTFINIEIFNSGTGAAAVNAVTVSGIRNAFVNCHIATLIADAATASQYSLVLSAASENLFVGGTIGTDTVDRGNNASANLHLTGACARNRFFGVEFLSYATGGTAHGAVKCTSTSGGRSTRFHNCVFANFGPTAQAVAVLGSAATNDKVWWSGNCNTFGFTALGAAGLVYQAAPSAGASGAGGIATTV